MPPRSTTALGFLIRSFSQSILSSPPASTNASCPFCSRSFCASATELGWYNWNAGITSRITAIMLSVSNRLNVRSQRVLHRPPRFERRQNCVQVHRCTAEDLISERIGQRIQDRSTASPHGRFADPTRAYRRLRIRNVQRSPLHVHGHIQNRRGLRVIKAQ